VVALVRGVTLFFSVCLFAMVGLFSNRSSDGGLSWISFVENRPYHGYVLFLMDDYATRTRQIAEDISITENLSHHAGNISPQWSPTGETLAYVDSYDSGDICFFKMGTFHIKCAHLDQHVLGNGGFTWSADGQWLFLTGYGTESAIYRISAQTLAIERLTTDTTIWWDLLPQTIPNSNWVLFVRGYGDIYRIHVVKRVLEPVFLSTSEPHEVNDMDVSPDGKWVVSIWNDDTVHLMLVNGSNDHRVASHSDDLDLHWITWSPTNQMLLVKDYPITNFYLVDPLTLEKRQLPIALPNDELGRIRDVAWSPDGKSLVLTAYSSRDEHYHLYRVNIDGSPYQLLRRSENFMAGVAWSPTIDLHWHRNLLIGLASSLLAVVLLFSLRKRVS
jgi:Tol biopolymer transport system component